MPPTHCRSRTDALIRMHRPVISDGRAGRPTRPDTGAASGASQPQRKRRDSPHRSRLSVRHVVGPAASVPLPVDLPSLVAAEALIPPPKGGSPRRFTSPFGGMRGLGTSTMVRFDVGGRSPRYSPRRRPRNPGPFSFAGLCREQRSTHRRERAAVVTKWQPQAQRRSEPKAALSSFRAPSACRAGSKRYE